MEASIPDPDADLKRTLKLVRKMLYDEKAPENALAVCESIHKQLPNNVDALVYKAAALEKMYFEKKETHTESVIDEANAALSLALVAAQGTGNRQAVGWVYFRLFVHYFNRKDYAQAKNFMKLAKGEGYTDGTLVMWESRLEAKLKKMADKGTDAKETTPLDIPAEVNIEKLKLDNTPAAPKTQSPPDSDSRLPDLPPMEQKSSFRTDWYQTPKNVTISLFTNRLPKDSSDVKIDINDGRNITVSYNIAETGSEFQYSAKLSHKVDTSDIKCKVFTKKIELTLAKEKANVTWASLDVTETDGRKSKPKGKDWSNIDIDDEVSDAEGDGDGTADSFFQKIYANADPDTQRAMMKSFIESNGTTLNTSWDDVKDGEVETVPPEGSVLKHF